MSIVLVMVWLLTAVMNIRAIYLRQVLWPGQDEDMEDIEGRQETGEAGR